MEQTERKTKLPLLGMLLTTALVLGGLYALYWWTGHRAEIYAQKALAAVDSTDWEQAAQLGEQAEAAGASDVLNALTYAQAQSLLADGDFDGARELFLQLGDYEDAVQQALACVYKQAEALEEAGSWADARDRFLSVAGYEDALYRADRCRYALAEQALAAGDESAAFQAFLELGAFEDAPQRARAIACAMTGEPDEELALMYAQGHTPEDQIRQDRIQRHRDALQSHRLAAGHGHAALLTDAGKVLSAGDNDLGQCETGSWTDVTALAAGYDHTLGLTANGRVLATGDNSCHQCETQDWTDVVRVFCGPWDSFGLRSDGTLLHCGFLEFTALSGWTNLRSLSAGERALFAVRQSGSLLSSQAEQGKSWQNLYMACPTGYTAAGLRTDGTLLSDSLDLSAWTDVVAIYSSATLLVGITLDGTLLIEPLLPADPAFLAALAAEKDVVGLALSGTYALVLHADGTLTAPCAPKAIQALCRPES